MQGGARIALCALALSASVVYAAAPTAAPTLSAEAATLDARTQAFSTRFFAHWLRSERQATDGAARESSDTTTDPVSSARTALVSLAAVEKKGDTGAALKTLETLLHANEWKSATRVYEWLSGQGDRASAAAASLLLAQYHFARERWDTAANLLQTVGAELPVEDAQHARLLHGIALQRLRRHRPALAQYAKIPATSRHYAAARLNMAVANIRQDWWTDAHTIMRDLLARDDIDAAFADRVYTVWGYSLLRQQYFRHARDTFRNVRLDGALTHKALLGIALSAAYQNDYVGALNAVTVLKGRAPADLAVDEAHLLLPYLYEKLTQTATATAGYAQAIAHYEQRIAAIDEAAKVPASELRARLLADAGVEGATTVRVADEAVDLAEVLPAAFFANLRLLAAFRAHLERVGDAALKREYATLDAAYTGTIERAVAQALNTKREFINHYMSQARFGLAAIDDNGLNAQ